ncbi:MAG: hypothetical protein BAJALOKI3v1_310034 [Promethearchaeota archaeon]|nr:MAG: hypothetical protein BAJALOKI3v1_310034 [Candidatus Lokiarchaeota archaeon]
MDLLKEYKCLYEQWREEFNKKNLAVLPQNQFLKYKKFYEFIDNFEVEDDDHLKKQILETYKDNICFMFKDILKMREAKIINSALNLREIDMDNIYEAEKLLFQNMVASIKGYQKVKSLSIYENNEKLYFPEIKPQPKEIEMERPENPIESLQTQENMREEISVQVQIEQKEINYSIVRFIKDTPSLVGIDLLHYGPFKKEDIANIPFKNAEILVNEKFAEYIDLS